MSLIQIGENIYTQSLPLVVAGFDFKSRMTLIRLEDGTVWVHSPIKLNEALKQEVLKIGPVSYLVSPNPFHHIFIDSWKMAFPNAKVVGFPKIEKKIKSNLDISILDHHSLWSNQIETFLIHGSSFYQEALFYHPKSKTVILTDLLFNFTDSHSHNGLKDKIILRLYGVYGRFKSSFLMRMILRDKKNVRTVLDEIEKKEINTITVCHGEVVQSDARQALIDALAWIK